MRFVFFILLFILPTFSAGQSHWNKYYSVDYCRPFYATLTKSKKIVFTGQTFTPPNGFGENVGVGLIDTSGELLWLKVIGDFPNYGYGCYSLAVTDDQEIIVGYEKFGSSNNDNYMLLSKLDTNGNILLTKQVGDSMSFSFPFKIQTENNGKLKIFAQSLGLVNERTVMTFDSLLNLTDVITLHTVPGVSNYEKDIRGGYFSIDANNAHFNRIDSSGNITHHLWHGGTYTQMYKTISLSDSTYIASGTDQQSCQPVIERFDSSGRRTDKFTYLLGGYCRRGFNDLSRLENGNFIVSGYYKDTPNSSCRIFIYLDSNLTIIKSVLLSEDHGYSDILKTTLIDGNNIYFIGYSLPQQKLHAFKTDTSFNFHCSDSLIAIGFQHASLLDTYQTIPASQFVLNIPAQNFSVVNQIFSYTSTDCYILNGITQDPIYARSLTFFPNPTSDKLFIQNKGLLPGVVKIFNLIGECIISFKIESSIPETILAVGELPNGLYLLELIRENNSEHHTFLKTD